MATPLGNPGDLSPRAAETLSRADCVLAEDTRRSGRLLADCGLRARRFYCLNDHNEEERLAYVLNALRQGENFALVSDAGTPLLSDPGYRLVRACREASLPVVPVPGPSAPLAALCASGLPPQPFVFLGFPPRKAGDRKNFFAPYTGLEATLIFFERKDRVRDTLKSASETLGKREACLARELTKTYEEFINFQLEDYLSLPEDLLGEITLLIGPPLHSARLGEEDLDKLIAAERKKGGKAKAAAKAVSVLAPGWSAKEIYEKMARSEK